MNRQELTEILTAIAREDLMAGSRIDDHPCSVAIKALDKCFDDIDFLKRIISNKEISKCKRAQMLLRLSYDPEW